MFSLARISDWMCQLLKILTIIHIKKISMVLVDNLFIFTPADCQMPVRSKSRQLLHFLVLQTASRQV